MKFILKSHFIIIIFTLFSHSLECRLVHSALKASTAYELESPSENLFPLRVKINFSFDALQVIVFLRIKHFATSTAYLMSSISL